jgi:hypothetical protein
LIFVYTGTLSSGENLDSSPAHPGKIQGIFTPSGPAIVGVSSVYGPISSIPFSAVRKEQGIISTVSGNFHASNKEFECVTGI